MFQTKKLLLFLLFMACLSFAPACGNTQDRAAAPPVSAESQSANGDKDSEKALKKLVIAEPLHYIGYLPLYVAQREGYFQKNGLDVKVISAAGGAHVTAVVSGDAWGVIGGPESNALANKNNSDPIISVVNVVNRANVYLMSKKGEEPKSNSPEDLKAFLKGKKINAGRHGGTPNLLTRYLLLQLGLNPDKDVQLLEPADGSTVVTMVQQGQADIANGAEPQISDGISKNVWGEPFYKFHTMGDYSYSVLSVKKSTIQKDPETVQKFVDAIKESLKVIQTDKDLAMKDLKAEFPTLSDDALKAALDRAYEDRLWSPDGVISEEALKRDMDVMIQTGIYKGDYTYEDLVDMQFVKSSD